MAIWMVSLTAICVRRSPVTDMAKQLTYTITDKENGLAVKTVLSKSLHLSRREISRLKFTNGLFLNDVSCRVTQPVKTGDIVHLIFAEKDTAHAQRILGKPDILYEDEDLVIVNKPAGMPAHPSHEHLDDDMGTLLQSWYHGRFTIRAIGRLDKDVSGVMVYARSQPAAARLSKQREQDILHKEYLAIIQGHMDQKSGMLEYRLKKVEGRKDRVVSANGQLCQTCYEVIRETDDFSLVKVHLLTGRTHQIRAGFAWSGHPLVGDRLYGGLDLLPFPALHCASIQLEQPFTHQKIHAEAPLREDMEALLKEKER